MITYGQPVLHLAGEVDVARGVAGDGGLDAGDGAERLRDPACRAGCRDACLLALVVAEPGQRQVERGRLAVCGSPPSVKGGWAIRLPRRASRASLPRCSTAGLLTGVGRRRRRSRARRFRGTRRSISVLQVSLSCEVRVRSSPERRLHPELPAAQAQGAARRRQAARAAGAAGRARRPRARSASRCRPLPRCGRKGMRPRSIRGPEQLEHGGEDGDRAGDGAGDHGDRAGSRSR